MTREEYEEKYGAMRSVPVWTGPTVFDMLKRTHWFMVVASLIQIANIIVILWVIGR